MIRRRARWLMGAGWRSEVLFDLGKSLAPGPHALGVRVVGPEHTLAVDIFEVGSRRGRGSG
jgi:hypothetical protein